ncbi:MAG: PadR family transcriptional regulator [Lachnospiraceae bacterium]|nr:PadR family transcriptional regulator [Lachnospiraceae bacterium]
MLKHGILGLLNYGDMTGYEIRTVFRDSLNHFWHAQTSQIYRELQVLEQKGWITVTHVEQNGKPDKNVLSITGTGREELKSWLDDETTVNPVRSAMLMKVFFRGECSIYENIEYFKRLSKRETVFPTGSEAAGEVSGEYKKMIDDPLKALYWKFTIDFGVMYDRMLKEWCDNCIHELEDLKDENTAY